MARKTFTYKDSGVDTKANARWVDRISGACRSTFGPRVLHRHNAFAGLFRLDFDEQLFRRNYRKPLLVGCTDGVGSKLMLAARMGDLSTVGIDLVAMNVNDLVTSGAEPLFFLDYLAIHGIDPAAQVSIIEGIAAGCRLAGCALLGGETAELPDLYSPGELDLAGFAVGVVELDRLIGPERVEPGDVLIGLRSSGVHSNGYSLVRRVIEECRLDLGTTYDGMNVPLGRVLLEPTRIYVKPILAVLRGYRRKQVVTGMAHITGGGLAENTSRALPRTCAATIRRSAWDPPPVFNFLQSCGIKRGEMYRVFNMGIGFVLIVRPAFVGGVCHRLTRAGESPVILGEVHRGSGKVRLV